ncbi:MAG: ATP-dependent helicase [Epsilonproteobacteria bacterium]|nr:ATP-dependent helicase [Campylobacterota bacterium]
MPLSNLNPEQYQAATTTHPYNLIIAGAGTGKTSTIVARIAYLLQQGVDPKKILLLTFTNKAAQEMIGRVEKRFSLKAKEIEAGTFHAISYRWLKESNPKLVLKPPKDLLQLFESVYQERKFLGFNNKPYAASTLFELYSLYQNSEFNLSFGEWLAKRSPEQEEFKEIIDDMIQEYEEIKEEYGFLSFNDLLLKATQLKDKKEFVEVLVDEYQDTNNLQAKFLESLKFNSLFCVGDYDQSIYAFNGANIEIIANFKYTYPNAKIFNLSKNYRSTSYILSLANKVISNNKRLYPKKLEVMRKEKPIPPKLLVFDTLSTQYEEIAKLIKSSPTPKSQIAILFRNNSSAEGIEVALKKQGISCKRRGGNSFFTLREVKAVFDLVSILLHPQDVISFLNILEYAQGIGKNRAKEIFDGLITCGEGDLKKGLIDPLPLENPFKKKARNPQLALFDDLVQLKSKKAINPVLLHPHLTPEGEIFILELRRLFLEVSSISNPQKFLKFLFDSKIIETISIKLAKQRARLKDGLIDSIKFQQNLGKIEGRFRLLLNLTKDYKDIHRFYNAIVLGSSEISQGEGVELLTVHASKGLEFEEVYVIDLMEERFPNLKLASRDGSLEEERRLFYVAVTRAKKILYLSYAKRDVAKKKTFTPSRFLKEAGFKVG